VHDGDGTTVTYHQHLLIGKIWRPGRITQLIITQSCSLCIAGSGITGGGIVFMHDMGL